MEYFVFILTMLAFIVIVFVKEAVTAKREEKNFIKSLYEEKNRKPQREYTLERFARIGSYYKKHKKEGQLDDVTWNDLAMDEIFKRMNYTFSATGEEYLYYALRSAGNSKTYLLHLEEVIDYFDKNIDTRVKIQLLMNKLGYTGKYSIYDYIDNLDALGKRSGLKEIILNLLFIVWIILIPFELSVALFGMAVSICYNIASYFKEKKEIEPYIISFVYIVRMLSVCDRLVKVEVPVCKEEWNRIKEHKNRLRSMRQGSSLVMPGASRSMSGNPLDIIMDYIRMVFHVDILLFNRMLSKLRANVSDVDALIGQIGFLETAIAIGTFRHSLENGYCIPEFMENKSASEGIFEIKEGYHPLLSNPVKNSISTQKCVLLTGSNASGKSTFLKMVAINAIMAQTIHTCAADAYRAPLFEIYSSMSLRDNLESGESYYIVEIKALKRILQAAKDSKGNVLCFVDEVLRGTNTVERIAASTQILKSLVNTNLLCFAATHDIELTLLLEKDYDNYHFEEEIKDGDIFFQYKLLAGKATTRNAIKLLRLMGYDQQIIENATKQAKTFLESGVWKALDAGERG